MMISTQSSVKNTTSKVSHVPPSLISPQRTFIPTQIKFNDCRSFNYRYVIPYKEFTTCYSKRKEILQNITVLENKLQEIKNEIERLKNEIAKNKNKSQELNETLQSLHHQIMTSKDYLTGQNSQARLSLQGAIVRLYLLYLQIQQEFKDVLKEINNDQRQLKKLGADRKNTRQKLDDLKDLLLNTHTCRN
ncbi:hypothetical protein RF11_03403 [Thelohanellus kitauei]|uniref:Uncharacterized protein n=1 Tax=Thelohanellus kitauei TaxID=669202 RepID=A0A0C2J6L2_THEKT|nr:hypothetical protein RF11_03403 [Thelohanellus kitauei]